MFRATAKMNARLKPIKHTLFWLSIVLVILAILLFFVTIYLILDSSFQEWVDFLRMGEVYMGLGLLTGVALFNVIVAAVGIFAWLTESKTLLSVHAALQGFVFLAILVATSVMVQYQTYGGSLQPIVAESMLHLISNSQYEGPSVILRTVQGNIGCCGINGPNDYLSMSKPLPSECRDTMTGNAFAYGCVDQLTWALEGKAWWMEGLSGGIMAINVVQAVLSMVHVQALDKRDKS